MLFFGRPGLVHSAPLHYPAGFPHRSRLGEMLGRGARGGRTTRTDDAIARDREELNRCNSAAAGS